MIQLNSIEFDCDNPVNEVHNDTEKLGHIHYTEGNKWVPVRFQSLPNVSITPEEMTDIAKAMSKMRSSGLPFLCLGIVEYQHEFFALELQRVFGKKVSNIISMEAPWGGQTVYVCEAGEAIHSEIKSFVTGFRSGFKSAL